ncbi:MAG: DUF1385 domain-containing protein [Clostridia bacterium]|nr:DUF1385 domain-containing protein [Clostridia bacterium]
MMRGPKKSAMAVRNPEGEIVLEIWETQAKKPPKILRLPIIRGVVGFISSMKAGYKALMRSAEIAGLEDEIKKEPIEAEAVDAAEEAPVTEATEPQTPAKQSDEKSSSVLMGVVMAVAGVLGVVLAVVLFVMLPTFLYKWCVPIMPFLAPDNAALESLIKSAFEGILKIVVLVAYMLLVTLMKDIRRTFQYHGAEHKTIFCYEHGMELTVENVRRERRFHPRCGTSFLVLMLLVGMFISFFIDPLFIWLTGDVPPTILRALLKLLLLPLTMGIGYELIKLAGRHDNLFTRIISAPGMWLQRVTVLEPTDDMIECAITAFKEVIPEDESDNF